MPAIYIMALVTLAAALALWGGLIYEFSGRQWRYLWLLPFGLPLSAVANLFIKRQAIVAVGSAAHVPTGLGLAGPLWFLTFQVLVGPAIEEALKILPLLCRPLWRMIIGRGSAFWVGFVLGVSFGLGEAAFIASAVAQKPDYAGLPWYAFTGYLNERLMACFGHGVFTAVLVTALARGPRFILPGYLSAFLLHAFFNLPVVLFQFGWISIGVESFGIVLTLVALAIVFERLRRSLEADEASRAPDQVVYLER